MLATTQFAVVGAGGLGCPALLGLVDAGARRLMIVDDDTVDASNLPRQVLFGSADVGAAKTAAASWSLRARARWPLTITRLDRRLDVNDLGPLFAALEQPAVVLECSDDPRLKFAIHDACVARNIPVIVAGVIGWRGQLMAVDPRHPDRACYRCLFENPPPPELAPACIAVGIIGAVAGTLGHAMALLAVGLATNVGEPAGALIHFDLLDNSIRRMAPAPRIDCPTCVARRESSAAIRLDRNLLGAQP